jgi:hypothetical protein
MSLLTTDITKVKRLSLREVRLPGERPVTPVETPHPGEAYKEHRPPAIPIPEKPFTEAEKVYSALLRAYPLLSELEDVLGLVNPETGNPYRKTAPPSPTEIAEPETAYTREEIKDRIANLRGLSGAEAVLELDSLVMSGEIERTIGPELYHLATSTPY